MKTTGSHITYWILSILWVIIVVILIKGCRRDYYDNVPASPVGSRRPEVWLKIVGRTKAVGLRIEVAALDAQGNPTGAAITPIEIPYPIFPLDVSLALHVPPCQFQVTVTASLTRDAPYTASAQFNACTQTGVTISLDTVEPVRVSSDVDPIHAPERAKAGESIEVSCGPIPIDAPDSDRFPVYAALSEQNGWTVTGVIGPKQAVTGIFSDPYWQREEERLFRCTIGTETFEKVVPRIHPCVVIHEHDSGPGSLRQVLADAEGNDCTTITFADGVSWITLSSELEITSSSRLTIDGGYPGVDISGNNSTRVFKVGSKANVAFEHLTIRDGYTTGRGGGIYNKGGTITLTSSKVKYNSANQGGGIANNGGTVTLNDSSVKNNTATTNGGGLFSLFSVLINRCGIWRGTPDYENGNTPNNCAADPGCTCP